MAKPQMAKPAGPIANGHGTKNPPTKILQSHNKAGSVKGTVLNKPRPAIADPRKIVNAGNGTGRPLGNKPLASKVPAQTTGTSRPPAKVMNDSYLKNKLPSAVPRSYTQSNHNTGQRRPSHSLNNVKSVLHKPLHPSNSQVFSLCMCIFLLECLFIF